MGGNDRVDVDEQDGLSLVQRTASGEWRIILAGSARDGQNTGGWHFVWQGVLAVRLDGETSCSHFQKTAGRMPFVSQGKPALPNGGSNWVGYTPGYVVKECATCLLCVTYKLVDFESAQVISIQGVAGHRKTKRAPMSALLRRDFHCQQVYHESGLLSRPVFTICGCGDHDVGAVPSPSVGRAGCLGGTWP
jgi:hypothetical protein